MAELNAYLTFQGNCREAMNFYQHCLGGQLHLMTIGETPAGAQMPPEMANRIMHSILVSGPIMIMGSDMVSDEGYTHGTTVSICLVCQSKAEIETIYNKLTAGGQVTTPLQEMFFGTYADFRDQFGFRWILQFSEQKLP